MPLSSIPQNPHRNTSPNTAITYTDQNYRDPFEIAQVVGERAGLPKEMLDQVHTHCQELVKDSWLGFLDMFNMNIPFETDYIQFVETTTPDFVIDDDGAVTRSGNDFTIDWSVVEGYETGEDAWFFRENFTILVTDDAGVSQVGVISAVDKANNTFTALCRDASGWTVAASNLTVDGDFGGDFDKGSCGPEGLLELRKKTSHVLKFITMKEAVRSSGGNRYAYCLGNNDDEVMWYDDNTLECKKRLNRKMAKSLMLEQESEAGSDAYAAGKFGTKGLFQNLEENGLVHTGYITDLAHLEAITTYWDSLGYRGNKEFICHCDTTQYRHFEQIASQLAQSLNVQLEIVLGNTPTNFMAIGFNSIRKDDYVIHFSKWGLTEGNSPLGKKRVKDVMPKGIMMPMGTVPTRINGVERNVPYIFKAYQDKAKMGKAGMIRTYFDGAFAGTGTCEYLEISKSTTVAIAVVCPEAITIIK